MDSQQALDIAIARAHQSSGNVGETGIAYATQAQAWALIARELRIREEKEAE